jgi:tRNA A-37 threonylcarbamoyl transferase component Bud32
MLYQVRQNSKIAKNVIKAFKELHTRKVCHGDVRVENILVRPDQSVVLIDFELSEMDADSDTLNAEMEEVKFLLKSFKPIQDKTDVA